MEKSNPDCHFCNVYPVQMSVLPLFLIATWVNSQKLHKKLRLRLELGKENLNN